jgi:hypothetical protein
MSVEKSKNVAVFGIYATPSLAESAVDHLIGRGFTNPSISVLLPDDESTRAFAHEKHTKAPEGTATGVTAGGIIGGSLGLLAGIGALAIPGVGPLIAAGPIVASLAGLGVGGAVGGFVGALVGMGIPEFEAKRYEGAVKGGGTLLSVHCDTSDEVDAAKRALKETGASDISSTGEAAAAKDTTVRTVENRDIEVVRDRDVIDSPSVVPTRDVSGMPSVVPTRDVVVQRDPVTGAEVVDDNDVVSTTRSRY